MNNEFTANIELDLHVVMMSTLGGSLDSNRRAADLFNIAWNKASTYFTMMSTKYVLYSSEYMDTIRDNILPLKEELSDEQIKVGIVHKYLLEYFGFTNTRFICPSTLADTLSCSYHQLPTVHGDMHTGGNIGLLIAFALIKTDGKFLVKDFRELRACTTGRQLTIQAKRFDHTYPKEVVKNAETECSGYAKHLKRFEHVFTVEDLLLVTKTVWKTEGINNLYSRVMLRDDDSERTCYPELHNTMFPALYSSNRTFTSYFNIMLATPFEAISYYLEVYPSKTVIKSLKELKQEMVSALLNKIQTLKDNFQEASTFIDLNAAFNSEISRGCYLADRFRPFFPLALLDTKEQEVFRNAVMEFQLNVDEISLRRSKFSYFNEIGSRPFVYNYVDKELPCYPTLVSSTKSISADAFNPTIKTTDGRITEIFTSGFASSDILKLIAKDTDSLYIASEHIGDFKKLKEASLAPEVGVLSGDLIYDLNNCALKVMSVHAYTLLQAVARLVDRTFGAEVDKKEYSMGSNINSLNSHERIIYTRYLVKLIEQMYPDTILHQHVDTLKDILEKLTHIILFTTDWKVSLHSTSRNYERLQRSTLTNIDSVYGITADQHLRNVANICRRLDNKHIYHDGNFIIKTQPVFMLLESAKEIHDQLSTTAIAEFEEFIENLTHDEIVRIMNSRNSSSTTVETKSSTLLNNRNVFPMYLNSRIDEVEKQIHSFAENLSNSFQMAIESNDQLFENTISPNAKFTHFI